MRVKVTVNIDSEVYKRSHELGVNVSQACTNYLKLLNRQIDATLTENKGFLNPCSFTKENGAGGEGFEPSTPNLGGLRGTAEYWNSFRKHISEKGYRGGWGSVIINYAQKYSDCLFNHDLTKVRDLREGLRPNVLKALSALAKFDGCYEDWKLLLKNYGVSWVGRSADEVFIDRLNSVQDSEEIWTWIKTAKQARSTLANFLDLIAVTGLRFAEAVNSYNLIVALNREGKLDSYYIHDALEHWRFKETFIRNTKKAFVSFVPGQIIGEIGRSEPLASANAVKRLIQKRKLPLRFGDIREAHGTFMTKFLKPSEIDFLHGRVTSSVFMANYFNPNLITDLKARTFQGIAEIQEKVRV